MPTAITLRDLRKEYGSVVAIENLDLDIKAGEFFTLLGPSGCGKTTLLRMIAGFNSIEGGTISFNDKVINNLGAGQRNIGMVFQNYALFPQMTAAKNVAFGLENRKVAKPDIGPRVERSLADVHMTGFADRLPGNMSGGQQQRVALARAMVISPSVLLMDEPLSNLDAKLRVEMRETIRQVQLESHITTVYVTHDQEEAMAVSDRIAVMKDGYIQHVGTPEEIYHRPANLFVADFIGKANELLRPLHRSGSTVTTKLTADSDQTLDLTGRLSSEADGELEVVLSVRPEAVSITASGTPGEIVAKTYLGSHTQYMVRISDTDTLEVSEGAGLGATRALGERVYLTLDAARLNVFSRTTTANLLKGAPGHGG